MKPLHILICDDDEDFAESLGDVLESRGHECTLVFTGEDAIRSFRDQDFDVAFMDVRLPGKDGVESFLEVRKFRPDARVFMMTAFSVQQLLERAVDNGALGILNKPFATNEILELVESIKPGGIVLVVDDDPDFAESVETLLTEGGYRVLVAHSGEEALERMGDHEVDLLVLDLRLPMISGLEVYLELKKRDRVVPTVIVTGHAESEQSSIDRLRDMSVTGCLIKPFEPKELLQSLESLALEDQ